MKKTFLLTVFLFAAMALTFSLPAFAEQSHPYDVKTCGTCHDNGMKSETLDCAICHAEGQTQLGHGSQNAPVWMPDIESSYDYTACNNCHTQGFHPGMQNQNQNDQVILDCAVCHGEGAKADVVIIHAEAHADFARLPSEQQVEDHSSCFNPYYGKNPNRAMPCHGGL